MDCWGTKSIGHQKSHSVRVVAKFSLTGFLSNAAFREGGVPRELSSFPTHREHRLQRPFPEFSGVLHDVGLGEHAGFE